MGKDSIYSKEATIIGIIISLIVLILLFITNNIFNDDQNDYCKKFKSTEIKGIIIDKKLEKDNHNQPIFYYRNEMNQKLSLFPFNKDFYEYVLVGDSILKKKNSKIVLIKRNSISKTFNFNFGCE